MQDIWISNKKGSRKLGSKEDIERRLNYAASVVENSTNDWDLLFWAIQAWHWALALNEN